MEILSNNPELNFQRRLSDLLGLAEQLHEVASPLTTRVLVMGDPSDWPYPMFRQAACDLVFIQDLVAINLKNLLPGHYWIHRRLISRQDIARGHRPTGSSQGPHIYLDDYLADYDATQPESDLINVIALHEAAHQLDDAANALLYEKIASNNKSRNGFITTKGIKQLKTHQELEAWKITVQALIQASQTGIYLYSSGGKELSREIVDSLRSQSMFLYLNLDS